MATAKKLDRRLVKNRFKGKHRDRRTSPIGQKKGLRAKNGDGKTLEMLLTEQKLKNETAGLGVEKFQFDLSRCDWKSLGFKERDPKESIRSWLRHDEHIAILGRLYGMGLFRVQLANVLLCPMHEIDELMGEHRERFAVAREQRAHNFVEAMEMDTVAVRKGHLDTDRARVVMQSQQWLAERLGGRYYGAKNKTELTGPDGGPIKVAPDEAAIERVKSRLLGPKAPV